MSILCSSKVLRTKIEVGIASLSIRSLTQIFEPLGYRIGIVKIDKDN